MSRVIILAWGLLPAVLILIWEGLRRRRENHGETVPPASAEGIRWSQYAGASYILAYAAVSLSWVDSRGPSVALLIIVGCASFSSALLLYYLGLRYGSEAPRLRDMREQCYQGRVALWRRGRVLTRAAFRSDGYHRWGLREDIGRADELTGRCGAQLSRLQMAMTTESFVRRLTDRKVGRDETEQLMTEQRRLLRDIDDFLTATQGVQDAAELALQLA